MDYKIIITINNNELELANQYAKICRYVRVSVCHERYWTVFVFCFFFLVAKLLLFPGKLKQLMLLNFGNSYRVVYDNIHIIYSRIVSCN